MKKLFFQNSQDFLRNKRFVFEVSDQEKSGMRAAMEVATNDEKEQLFDEKKKLDKEKIKTAYTTDVDKYIAQKNAEIKGKETDKDKQTKLEADYKAALDSLRAEFMNRLEKLVTDAEAKREANAKAWANGMSETLVKFNRESVKDGLDATMKNDRELYKHVDEIDSGAAMTTPQIKSMLEVIYIEEGRNAALDMAKKMEQKSEGMGNNMDIKAFNELYGDTVKKTLDDLKIYPGYPNNVDMGRMWGLAYEAQQQFGTDKDGKAAYDAYLAALQTQFKNLKGNYQEIQNAVKAFPTPSEWATQNPEYRFALKKYAEAGAKEADINQLLEKVQDSGVKQNLRGIMDGILASEPDAQKRQALIDKLFKDMGKNLEDVGSLKFEDLNKASNDKSFGDGAWKLNNDERTDSEGKKVGKIADRVRGYLSGLMYSAENLDYGTYASDMSVQGKTHDVAIAYKAYIAEQMKSDSALMKEVLKDNDGFIDKKDRRKKSEIEAAIMEKIKGGLKSPTAFATEIYDKEWEKEYTEKGQINERGFVRAWLTEIDRKSGSQQYDRMEGALLAVIQGKDRSQWHQLIEQQVEAITGRKGSGNDYLTDKDFKGLQDNVIKGREAYNAGWTVDSKSQGYVSGMLYHSEHIDGASPEFAKKYKDYVQEQMKKLDQDQDFKVLVQTRTMAAAMAGGDPTRMLAGTDVVDKQMYAKTVELLKSPEDFLKDQQEKDKPKIIESNKKFLDTYNNPSALKDPKTIDKILSAVPKDKLSDADRKKEIDELKAQFAKATDNTTRLKILADAKGYADHIMDPDVAEGQYEDAAFNYDLTKRILGQSVMDIAKKEEDYKKFLGDVAKQFNLSENGKEVTEALDKIKTADPAKRAAAIAEQLTILANKAVGVNGGAAPTWAFSTENFDIYTKYIEEKNKQAQKAKKASAPSGGVLPSTAPSTTPRIARTPAIPGARGSKAKVGPAEKDEENIEAGLAAARSAVVRAIISLNGQHEKWNDMEINSVAELAARAKTDAEVNLSGLDLSKLKDQTLTIAGAESPVVLLIKEGKATVNADAWAAHAYPHAMELNKEMADKKDVETKLQAYQGAWIQELNKQGGGTGFPGIEKGVDVRQAIDNRWTAGKQLPAELMAKAAQIPDLKTLYKPGTTFGSKEILFKEGKGKVTIYLQYDASGKLSIVNGNETWS